MQTGRLFRLAAIAWLVTALTRLVLAVVGEGPTSVESSAAALAVGAAVGIAVAALLWLRPVRSSAIAATLVGFYAVVGLAYAPLVGLQAWFVALSATGLVAFVLSVACWVATRRPPVRDG